MRRTTYEYHGLSRHPQYKVWAQMIARCEQPSNPEFHNYGARGITVCARWHDSFRTYLAEVGLRPSKQLSLDRINNNGHYEPGNMRWATPRQQSDNRRTVNHYAHNGQSLTLNEWADRAGLTREAFRSRLRKGWNFDKALSTPISLRHRENWMKRYA